MGELPSIADWTESRIGVEIGQLVGRMFVWDLAWKSPRLDFEIGGKVLKNQLSCEPWFWISWTRQ